MRLISARYRYLPLSARRRKVLHVYFVPLGFVGPVNDELAIWRELRFLIVETRGNDLRRFRLLGQESEAKRQTFDELIAEIRDLKMGAFAPLTEQPFIRAVLFPGAALGLLAVGQRLLDIF